MKMKDYMCFFRNMAAEDSPFFQNVLEVKYSTETGHGNFRIDMEKAFPVSKSDFRKLCGIVRLATDEKPLETLTAYIDAVLHLFNEYRQGFSENDTKMNADITANKKRWQSMREILEKEFSVPSLAEDTNIVKFKKTDVLCMIGKHGQAQIELHSGFRFEKFGFIFHCYQESRAFWKIIVPQFGLAIGSYANSKAACAETITETIARQIESIFTAEPGTEKGNKTIFMRADFEKAVSESDFAWIFEKSTDYIMPVSAATEETPTATETTTEAVTIATETTTGRQDAETATESTETLPNTQHIDIMAFCAEYRQILQKLRCDPLFMPKSRPADRQKRKQAISFYDETLSHTELYRQFINSVHDIIDTAQKATAFTLAYYATVNRQATETETAHRNDLQVHSVYYRQARHTMPTGRTETPYAAVFYTVPGRLCLQDNRHAQKQKTRTTGSLLSPCLVFRTIPCSVCTCRAIVTDSS